MKKLSLDNEYTIYKYKWFEIVTQHFDLHWLYFISKYICIYWEVFAKKYRNQYWEFDARVCYDNYFPATSYSPEEPATFLFSVTIFQITFAIRFGKQKEYPFEEYMK